MSERPFKKGDIDERGRVFWGYEKQCPNGQRWLSVGAFERRLERSRRLANEYYAKRVGRPVKKIPKRTPEEKKDRERERNRLSLKKRRDAGLVPERPLARRIACACNARIKMGMKTKGWSKSKKTQAYLGCSWPVLRAHIEAQFTEGMTWENWSHSGWHMDHIIPVASATSLDELLPLLHYTNLQPLWAQDNWRKSDSMPASF